MGKKTPALKHTWRPNYAEKVTVDLGVARSSYTSLNKSGEGIYILAVDGNVNMRITCLDPDSTTIILDQDDLNAVVSIDLSFSDIEIQNSSQAGKSLKFVVLDVR